MTAGGCRSNGFLIKSDRTTLPTRLPIDRVGRLHGQFLPLPGNRPIAALSCADFPAPVNRARPKFNENEQAKARSGSAKKKEN